MKFGTLARINAPEESFEVFKKIKDIGLESCQLVYKPTAYDVSEAAVIKQAAEENGIEISAFFAGYQDNYTKWDIRFDYRNAGINSTAFGAERLKYVISALPFVHALGVTDVALHAGFIPNDPFAAEYAEMLCRIKLLADEAKKLDMNILFETGGESPVTLLRTILEVGTGNLFVNLDTGNLIMYGYGNPADAVVTLGNYIRNIHAKDGVPPTDPYKIGKERPIGQGAVDFYRTFKYLQKIGYDRFITIEREIWGEEQTRDILSGLDYIKNILNQEEA